jgi:hypothetical protein
MALRSDPAWRQQFIRLSETVTRSRKHSVPESEDRKLHEPAKKYPTGYAQGKVTDNDKYWMKTSRRIAVTTDPISNGPVDKIYRVRIDAEVGKTANNDVIPIQAFHAIEQ